MSIWYDEIFCPLTLDSARCRETNFDPWGCTAHGTSLCSRLQWTNRPSIVGTHTHTRRRGHVVVYRIPLRVCTWCSGVAQDTSHRCLMTYVRQGLIFTPSCDVKSPRRPCSSVLSTDNAVPLLRARPVRPARCRYESEVAGQKSNATQSKLGTSIPRADRSVVSRRRTGGMASF